MPNAISRSLQTTSNDILEGNFMKILSIELLLTVGTSEVLIEVFRCYGPQQCPINVGGQRHHI